MKTCRSCLKRLPVDQFHKNRRNADGLQAKCKACSLATTYAYRNTENGLIRMVVGRHKSALKRYGITAAEYEAMMAAQKYVCAICKKPERITHKGATRRLAVDHCHETGVIRGLLCGHCNQAIGKFNEDPNILRAAIDYLAQQRLV